MAEPISYDDFAKLELRVAKVLEARPHPNADKLLLLQVDVGDQQKQIVAGIREHYTPEQLAGKLIGELWESGHVLGFFTEETHRRN